MKKRVKVIQLLRVISCISVFGVHMGQRLGLGGMLRKVTDLGMYGPYVFFMISGFVAFFSVEEKGREQFNKRNYYIERLLKILPLYYFVILINFVLHTFILKDIPADPSGLYWMRYIFFLNRIIPVEENFWSNLSAVWSLSSFMLFYLLFPLLAKYINGLFSVILVWLLTICLRVLSIPHINLEPVVMLKYFLFGGVIFYLWKRKDKKLQISMLMMSLCILYYLYTKHLDAWIVVFVAGISILIGSEITIENKMFDRIISLMDEYSYSIYLIHALFIEAIDRYKEHTTNPNWKVMALVVGLFGTIVGSVIVHNIIEKPIQRYVRKRVQL